MADDAVYPLIKANTSGLTRHSLGGLLMTFLRLLIVWALVWLIVALVNAPDPIVTAVEYGGPVLAVIATLWTARWYRKVADDPTPLLFATADAVFQRTGGLFGARATRKVLDCGTDHSMKVDKIDTKRVLDLLGEYDPR